MEGLGATPHEASFISVSPSLEVRLSRGRRLRAGALFARMKARVWQMPLDFAILMFLVVLLLAMGGIACLAFYRATHAVAQFLARYRMADDIDPKHRR
jgi:hypothetical protein